MGHAREHGRASQRRLPVGAEVVGNGVHFRVWAPRHRHVAAVLESGAAAGTHDLAAEDGGYFAAHVPGAAAGDHYRFRLGTKLVPDPASRFQPEGPHGPSQVIDPAAFAWTD